MSATGRSNATAPAASDAASRVADAGFVRVVGAATGDGLAASGVLARTLGALDRPFQVSLAPLAGDAERATDADLTVAVGRVDPTADLHLPGTERPASETALAVARELGTDPDSETVTLALAGALADGRVDGVAETAADAGLARRPGLAVPTTDLADGLAHSTLVHLSVSGHQDRAADLLADHGLPTDAAALDEEDRRRLASAVALAAVGDDDRPPRAGDAVERALRPYAGGPVETVGGYADVLDAVARERPGTGVAFALGRDVADDALAAWRTHARRAHAAVRDAETGRYDGLFVARCGDAPVGTTARLLYAYRSPEPVTLVATDGAAAVAGETALGTTVSEAAEAVGGVGEATGSGAGTTATGRARFDAEAEAFVTAFRETQL